MIRAALFACAMLVPLVARASMHEIAYDITSFDALDGWAEDDHQVRSTFS